MHTCMSPQGPPSLTPQLSNRSEPSALLEDSGLSFAAPVPQFVITQLMVWLPLGSVSLGTLAVSPALSTQADLNKDLLKEGL